MVGQPEIPKVENFYHIYCVRHWKDILLEHFPLVDSVRVGIIGNEGDKNYILKQADVHSVDVEVLYQSTVNTHEHRTLECLDEYCDHNDGHVRYFHTKAVTNDYDKWRHYLNQILTTEPSDRPKGCFYIRENNKRYPDGKQFEFFGGNFWIAPCSYIRSLPLYKTFMNQRDRFVAEVWIGSGSFQPEIVGVQTHDLGSAVRAIQSL